MGRRAKPIVTIWKINGGRSFDMGKKVYTINGRMYLIDDETGEVKTIYIQSDTIPPNDLKEIIKILAQNQKED